MSLGLLQGFGRGISQSAELLSRGMSEDREVERQRMREASIEKRWKRQEQKDDARYADSVKFREEEVNRQKERDTVNDGRYADSKKLDERQMSLAEQQAADRKELAQKERIEQTLGRLEKEAEREGAAIDRRFDRQIDIAKANGANADEIKKLHAERDTALQGVNAKLSAKMLPALKSFGNELQGTAYASYYDQILAEQESSTERQGQQFLTDAGVVGADGNFTNTASPKPNGRIGFVSDARGGVPPKNPAPTQAPTTAVKPGFVTGLNNGLSGFVNETPAADPTNTTPLEKGLYGVGTLAAAPIGVAGDTAQRLGSILEKGLLPAWQWLNTPEKR